ncbi:hypothetical protein [Nocardiopsis sp. NRRL B-16309]|uniref:hypothetical protein n=1 Tax=Nocardiopsis sp. NRRL B-16309 TaxID=1519494 RepID=UPI0006AF6D2C|nr:hypothetical protein [Nocardiopsis sp. NRRL B-16309]KOX10164.1 hypothetical protein ADL05_26175 [Nocardiopsis sp. NRRL B-16309]
MKKRPDPVGTRGCVCAGCNHSFTSPSAFDKHQKRNKATGRFECHHPSTVGLEARVKNGVEVWGAPGWITAGKPMPWTPAA